ncbi:Fic family protein [Helicobacter sp. MIT 14-3879]|nr:Fic family protein [Helicobacter sp. MIT 14-3879]RDU61481.1 Fic family protein [Helicobacter sp. MIT 14-3879]
MKSLLQYLLYEKNKACKNGLYHHTQISFAYNSNHIEGSTLSKEQTRYIYEKDSFLANENQIIKTNDILGAKNHFRAFDYILDTAFFSLDKDYIKKLHFLVKQNCTDIMTIGDFKKKQNFVGNIKTTPPNEVDKEIKNLLQNYKEKNSIEQIIDFHFHFEKIHPFEDGNGRVGRLVMFKECLKNDIVPFIIDEEHKLFYYRGLREYNNNKGFLIDTCLSCQDKFKEILEYFDLTSKQETSNLDNLINEVTKAKGELEVNKVDFKQNLGKECKE